MLVYNVPARMADSYSNRNLILRSRTVEESAEIVGRWSGEEIFGIQLQGIPPDIERLKNLGRSLPVEIVLHDCMDDYGSLYDHPELCAVLPIYVNVQAKAGFHKAVKTAVSLGFAVRMEGGQPDPDTLEEMKELLDFYLHQSLVDRPIEFFHGLLIAFYDGTPRNLWNIQCEDPEIDRYVKDDGTTVLSDRLDFLEMPEEADSFLGDLRLRLLSERGECSVCPFFVNCVGYFKFPDDKYSCEGVKELLGAVKKASVELRREFGSYRP